jgi:hypothetical protein
MDVLLRFTEDEGLTMVEQHLWLPSRLHPLRRRPVLLRRRRVQGFERAVERGRLREFPTQRMRSTSTEHRAFYLHNDMQALQSAVQRLEGYVKGLEQDVKSRK